MNTLILSANFLTLLAFVIHTFVGDKELRAIEPTNEMDENFQKRESVPISSEILHFHKVYYSAF